MAFCTNCGKNLPDGAKFCFECGTRLTACEAGPRESVYEGNVHKCPNCGEVLDSITAICPACNYEIRRNSQLAIMDFKKRLEAYDFEISKREADHKGGWKEWKKEAKVLWVLLNVFLFAVPVFVYWIWPKLTCSGEPSSTGVEKEKTTFIENYTFPNEREAALEMLNYSVEQSDFYTSQPTNRKNVYWANFWANRAEQYYKKADMLLSDKGDASAITIKNRYQEISENKEIVKKKVKRNVIISCVGLLLAMAMLVTGYALIISGIKFTVESIRESISDAKKRKEEEELAEKLKQEEEERQRKWEKYHTSLAWKSSGLYAQLPEPNTGYGEVVTDTEDELCVDLYQMTVAMYEEFIETCEKKGFTVGTQTTTSSFYAKNDRMYALSLNFDVHEKTVRVTVNGENALIEIGAQPSDLIGKSKEEVVSFLMGRGYKNVSFKEVRVAAGYAIPNNAVESVSFGGASDVSSNSVFSKKTAIVVNYCIHNIVVGKGSSEFEKMLYGDVVSYFRSRGFMNITTTPLTDLITGWVTKDGETESVSINGSFEFDSNAQYAYDAQIVITYHTFKSKD